MQGCFSKRQIVYNNHFIIVLGDNMRLRRNFGICLMLLGIILTMNQGSQNNEIIENLRRIFETYWPLIISFIGVYFVSVPKKRR